MSMSLKPRPQGLARLINTEMQPILKRIEEPGFRCALVTELEKLHRELKILAPSPPRSTIDRWFSGQAVGNPNRILPGLDRWTLIKKAASRIRKPRKPVRIRGGNNGPPAKQFN